MSSSTPPPPPDELPERLKNPSPLKSTAFSCSGTHLPLRHIWKFIVRTTWNAAGNPCEQRLCVELKLEIYMKDLTICLYFQTAFNAIFVGIQSVTLASGGICVDAVVLRGFNTSSTDTCPWICQKSRRIGCVIPHCRLQRGITQLILCLTF